MCSIFQIQIDPLKFITDTLKALSRPIGYLRDPERRITRLIDAMKQLEAESDDRKITIRRAEHDGEVPTNQVQEWFKKVDNFLAHISKIIDDHKKGKFRWCINSRAAHTLVDIKEFRENFVLEVLTAKLPPKRVQEVPAKVPVATMDTYLSKLQTALRDENSRIIGIWGMGGVGKTTLLSSLNNKLYRHISKAKQSQHNFDYVIWAVGSMDYKLKNLQRDITERLGLPLCEDTFKQAVTIMDFLKNKSFLLLLDDLWQPVNFEELGIPNPSLHGATKQKVVFTTRDEVICGQMHACTKIKIECLSKVEAWRLFEEKVGKETIQANPRIPTLAQQVAQECDGLPLALVLIGSAMSTKKTPMEWQDAINQLRKSRPHEIHGMNDKIFSSLKFSYDNLANEILRKCFVLCSLWPEDLSISKIDLIECWMGHGLMDESKFETINEAYDRGYSFIGALEATCLLEPSYNKVNSVKMHDLVRDLALWIASDCGKKPNRFVVNTNDIFFLRDISSELQTLILNRNYYFKSIEPRLFEVPSRLTYLDLSYTKIYELPGEIGLLGKLRYLNLSSTLIKLLPLELGNLCELRFLLLRDMNTIHMPCGVLEKLEMLSMIDMTNTWCKNWKELSKLRGNLKGVGILLQTIEDLEQLAQLPNVMTWRLGLRNIFQLNKPLQLLSHSQLGSRSIRSSIQYLTIRNSMSLEVISMESDAGDGIQKWCLSRLEELKLTSLPMLHDIIWQRTCPAKMLPSLTVLTIDGCHNLSNISWVIQLPSLQYLSVICCENMKQITDDYSEFTCSNDEENDMGIVCQAFSSLRTLNLYRLNSLREFGGTYSFPSLELLEVLYCPKMKTLPFGTEKAGKKLKKICGERNWWEELNMEDNLKATLLPYFEDCSPKISSDIDFSEGDSPMYSPR